tara:strand:- start:348 stop:716 length:369 start_codon:yes stop_codon:yes gene_type:complete
MVKRLSLSALKKIMAGETVRPTTCIIKFYSNNCDYCHNLHEYYEDIASSYEDINFFAFNVEDYPTIESELNFRGVPTIFSVKIGESQTSPAIRMLEDPTRPNKHTWYHANSIKSFIEKAPND